MNMLAICQDFKTEDRDVAVTFLRVMSNFILEPTEKAILAIEDFLADLESSHLQADTWVDLIESERAAVLVDIDGDPYSSEVGLQQWEYFTKFVSDIPEINFEKSKYEDIITITYRLSIMFGIYKDVSNDFTFNGIETLQMMKAIQMGFLDKTSYNGLKWS